MISLFFFLIINYNNNKKKMSVQVISLGEYDFSVFNINPLEQIIISNLIKFNISSYSISKDQNNEIVFSYEHLRYYIQTNTSIIYNGYYLQRIYVLRKVINLNSGVERQDSLADFRSLFITI